MNMTVMWLVIAVVLFVIEAATVGLVCMWFGIGAVVTMLISFVISNIYIQWGIFIVVSLAMLLILRPLAKDVISRQAEKTNVSALVGKNGYLTVAISDKSNGQLKLGDVMWTAVSADGEAIDKGQRVSVVSVKGNKLVVSKI